jgi:hypothetical protein
VWQGGSLLLLLLAMMLLISLVLSLMLLLLLLLLLLPMLLLRLPSRRLGLGIRRYRWQRDRRLSGDGRQWRLGWCDGWGRSRNASLLGRRLIGAGLDEAAAGLDGIVFVTLVVVVVEVGRKNVWGRGPLLQVLLLPVRLLTLPLGGVVLRLLLPVGVKAAADCVSSAVTKCRRGCHREFGMTLTTIRGAVFR